MTAKTKAELLKDYEDAEARLAEFTPGEEALFEGDLSEANVPLADLKMAIADRDAKLAAYEAAPDDE